MIEDILKKIGVDESAIKSVTTADEALTIIRSKTEESLRNDNAFMRELNAKAEGKVLSMTERKLAKQFGLADADVKDKQLDDVIKIAHERATSGNKAGSGEAVAKMQGEIQGLYERVKAYEEVEIPRLKNEYESHIAGIRIQRALTDSLNSIGVVGKAEYHASALSNVLSSKYAVVSTDSGFDIFQKGTDNLRVLDANKKPLTAEEVVRLEAAKLDIIKQSKADDTGVGKTVAKTVNSESAKKNQYDNIGSRKATGAEMLRRLEAASKK